MLITEINDILNAFIPVGLDEMDHVRLMNRMDTKYILPVRRIPDLLSRLNGNYKVLEVNNSRLFSYYTTYLDTNDYLFFNQHVTGRLERNKVRYRKYEITGITYLEVKKRTNKNRTIKWRIKNDLQSDQKCDHYALDFIKKYIPYLSLSLKPVLTNNFTRVTMVGTEINERVTIDYDLSFSNQDGNQINFPSLAVIELKREGYFNGSRIATVLKESSIHPTSFSKYCIGAAVVHDLPRKNLLKPNLLLINKIENECT